MYWTDRKKQLDAEMTRNENQLFSRMKKYYATQAALLDKEIAGYYAKYGESNVIAYRKLLESLTDADRNLLMQKMNDFAVSYPQYAHLLPIRESIYQLNKLEGLRQSVAVQQLTMGAYEQKAAQSFFKKMALRYANGAAEQMGYGSSFYRFDHAMAKIAVGNKWCQQTDFSDRIWDNRKKLTNILQSEIVNSFIRGDSYQKASRILQKKFISVSQNNIERLIFTEDTYLANEAAIQVFANDSALSQYEFICTNDVRTCEICKSLSEQRFDITKRYPGVNFPPMHPWCRCFFNPVWDESKRSKDLTFISESDTMKIPSTLTYFEESQRAYLEKIKDSVLKEPENQKAVEETLKSLIDNGHFCMGIDEHVLLSVESEGKFKTLFETGTSNGDYVPEERKLLCAKIFGSKTNEISDTDFEKYGFLSTDIAATFKNGDVSNYGNLIVEFNKTLIANRTTFTIGDSLASISYDSDLFASKVTEPSVCAVPSDCMESTIEAAKSYLKNKISATHFAENAGTDYIELQYHGELTPEHVSTVYYQDTIDELLKQKLESHGIHVIHIKER